MMPRGWKGNKLGLQRWEVMSAHEARVHATEAIADLMRKGKTFPEAKAAVVKRAASVYRHSRPELFQGHMACVNDVQFADMPPDILRSIEDRFRASLGRDREKPPRWIDRILLRWFGVTW